MNKTITVKFDEERLKALKKYLKRKASSTVEQELEYALTRLYDKTVPVTVREYLEEDSEDAEDSSGESEGSDGHAQH